jgi:DNA-3-methyladenine glycosylase II
LSPIHDPLLAAFPRALARWRTSDPVLARIAKAPPALAYGQGDGFTTMLQSLTHQQISMAAGRAIWGRFVTAVGGTAATDAVRPDAVLALGEDGLRAAGLSRAKAGYFLDLADKTLRGDVEWARFPAMDDASVLAELTAVKGIGPWTAKMYLMFQLHRPDVNCPEDVGLQEAVTLCYGVERKAAAAFIRAQAPAWSPHNTLAARTLWHVRREA